MKRNQRFFCLVFGLLLALSLEVLYSNRLDLARSPQQNPMTEVQSNATMTIGSTAYFQSICETNRAFLQSPLECSSKKQQPEPPSDAQLLERLNCETLRQSNYTINFFSFAHGDVYKSFLPLYAFSAVQSNNNSVVEMVVDNRTSFVLNQKHRSELVWFIQEFPGSLCVRNLLEKTRKRTGYSNTWRYLELPSVAAEYTYIGDVDIFLTESVLDKMRFEQMEHFGLPYSNVIRPGSKRLTGVMLVRSRDFFTQAYRNAQETAQTGRKLDEMVLYDIVSRAGLGLPGTDYKRDPFASYRPLHGLHLSSNRGPGKRLCLPGFSEWCDFLALPQFGNMLCAGSSGPMLMNFMDMVIKQEEGNMTVEGQKICRTPPVNQPTARRLR